MSAGSRVLMVITSMARGGAERQVVDLAAGLTRRGWEVRVVSMLPPRDFQAELATAGVGLVSLDMRRGRPTVAALRRYRSVVRGWHPDIVHSHMVHANLLARLGRVLVPAVPLVCTIHNVNEGPRWRELAYRVTDPLASSNTAVSRVAAERFQRVGAVPRGRITYLPNGHTFGDWGVSEIERQRLRADLGVSPDAFLWLAVGRLMPAKGHDVLLEALARVALRRPDVRAVIAGEGPERAALSARTAALGLAGTATLLGERRDVPALLSAADAFVMSSRWEGLPIALLEAAAHGLPIVSTDAGGSRDVVDPESGGVLVGTSADSLAAGMLSVMEWSPAERAHAGLTLRAHAKAEFDLDLVLDRWEVLYQALLEMPADRWHGSRRSGVRA